MENLCHKSNQFLHRKETNDWVIKRLCPKLKQKDQRTSFSWLLTHRWNISFVNIVLEILRICPRNITELQKPKEGENCQIWNFLFYKCSILLTDSSTTIFKKKKKCASNISFLYNFLNKNQNMSPYYYVITKNEKTLQFLKLTFSSSQLTTRI